jgi:hypothetical protein
MEQKRWWGSRPSTRTEEKDEDIEKIWGWLCKIWGEQQERQIYQKERDKGKTNRKKKKIGWTMLKKHKTKLENTKKMFSDFVIVHWNYLVMILENTSQTSCALWIQTQNIGLKKMDQDPLEFLGYSTT